MSRRLRLTVMAMALAICWLGATAGEALAVADTEPNNHFTQAAGPVTSGVKVTGAITASGDVDYYYFYVGALSDVTLAENDGSSSRGCELYRYDGGYLSDLGSMGGSSTKQLAAASTTSRHMAARVRTTSR